ncbi:hypothetical protein O181_112188 [Austropuccinia psidii MF-1]|uniref:Uncharacterized protein n=1 Tax=Austropuccinia psidii MF-1 TaxID=1389203 RepID=A0A9Q3K0V3_9BASI|nr:hypothetical protein [Austropuccinia psidii MF-1]
MNPSSLTHMVNPPQSQIATLLVLESQTSSGNIPNASKQFQNEPLPQAESHYPGFMTQTQEIIPRLKYNYVTCYNTAPDNISGELNAQKIIRGE